MHSVLQESMNINTGIIADDLTGAGDSSMYFCHAGFSVFLPQSLEIENIPVGTSVLAINSESRLVSEDEAYKEVSTTVKKCLDMGVSSFYKKIDSTLRGNIDAEVNAMIDSAGYKAAVICPASPDVGRTVIDGYCYINGDLINKTETGNDHLSPVASSHVKDLFHSVNNDKIYHFPIEDIEKGSDYLQEKVNELLSEGISRFICDAKSHTHLNEIARLFSDNRLLLVGSSGLAKAISFNMSNGEEPDHTDIFRNGEILVVSGSRMDITRQQIRILSEQRGFPIIKIPVTAILHNDEKSLKVFKDSLENLGPSESQILIPDDYNGTENPEELKLNSEIIADYLADTVVSLCSLRDISVLVVVGGHTTFKTMNKLNALGVLYKGEVIPGSPFGELINQEKKTSCSLVTKSGSFGDVNALVKIVDFVNKSMQVPE